MVILPYTSCHFLFANGNGKVGDKLTTIKIKEVIQLSVGQRLSDLIQEGIQKGDFSSQKGFIRCFNEWIADKHANETPITEKDLSRWKNDKVKPRLNKIELFAEFFNVNTDYLLCKEYRKPRISKKPLSVEQIKEDYSNFDRQNPNLLEEIKKQQKLEDFQKYCEQLGFKFNRIVADKEPITWEDEVIKDGKLFTLEITDDSVSDVTLEVIYPNGGKVRPSINQFEEIIGNVDNMIHFEFSKLKG